MDVGLTELVEGGTRRGVRTNGTIVLVTGDSGITERCPVQLPDRNRKCRKRLRDGIFIDDVDSERGRGFTNQDGS